jgi:predicted Zn finger-like uncharacterized protein
MEVSCPKCAQSFMLPKGALGLAGRKLKCSKCQHVWFHAPGPPHTTDNEVSAAEKKPMAQTKIQPKIENKIGVQAAEVTKTRKKDPLHGALVAIVGDQSTKSKKGGLEENPDQKSTYKTEYERMVEEKRLALIEQRKENQRQNEILEARKSEKRKLQTRVRLLVGTFIFALAFVVSVFAARPQLVSLWPPVSKFYDAIGLPVPVVGENLVLEDIVVQRLKRKGNVFLSVAGKVINTSDEIQLIPAMCMHLLNSRVEVVQERFFGLDVNVILPQEVISFSQELQKPDPDAEDVIITFAASYPEDEDS